MPLTCPLCENSVPSRDMRIFTECGHAQCANCFVSEGVCTRCRSFLLFMRPALNALMDAVENRNLVNAITQLSHQERAPAQRSEMPAQRESAVKISPPKPQLGMKRKSEFQNPVSKRQPSSPNSNTPFKRCEFIKNDGTRCGWNSWATRPESRPLRHGSPYCAVHLDDNWEPTN